VNTYEWFRDNATDRPIAHGNGFIQVPLPDDKRLHVWHPKCPRQKVYTGIHDHRFGFKSEILRGILVNQTWATDYGNVYEIYRPGRESEGENPWQLYRAKGKACRLHRGYEHAWSAGETYYLDPGIVHDSIPSTPIVVTLMRKLEEWKDYNPIVLCLAGQEPDNSFRRDLWYPEALWILVKDALK